MGKKGSSGTNAKVRVPSQVDSNAFSESNLGVYAEGLLSPTLSMANWASDIATGGNVSGANPYAQFGSNNSGPLGYSTSQGNTLNSGVQQFGGFGGTGVTGGTGATGGTAATAGTPGTAATTGFGTASTLPGVGASQADITSWWQQNQGKTIQTTSPNGDVATVTISGNAPNQGTFNSYLKNFGWKTGGGTAATAGTAGTAGTAAGGAGQSESSLLGPFLSNAWNAIQAEGQGANQLTGEGTQLYGEGQSLLGQGESALSAAQSGSGLLPSQQAWVNQGVSSQQAAIQQQMASEGLTSSTQNIQMKGEAAQAGAATAGQLIQGNEQIAQSTISLGENFSQLGAATQQAAIQSLTSMATQSLGMQSQMWTEAMQGYGLVGQFLNDSVAAFDYSNKGWDQFTEASGANATITAQEQGAGQQASANGMSSLLGGIGSLLGSGSGGGGGLIGSLGGILGSAGASSVGGAASAAVGGSAAAGGVISAIGGALSVFS